jgi:excisionase family DNA binding protein
MALLRPSELARAWELHPKTVYLWIREGRLPALKTPGAQYRVRSDDARAYCEKHDLPMPRGLASPGGRVTVIGKASAPQRALAKACKARGAELAHATTALDGLIAAAAEPPDVLAIDAGVGDVKVADALRALRKNAKTEALRVVIYDAPPRSTALAKLGAASVVPKGDPEALARVVTELLSSTPATPASPARGRG